MSKDKIKNYLIFVLVGVLLGLGLFGGRKVSKYHDEIISLEQSKNTLTEQNKVLDDKIRVLQDTITVKDARIKELMRLFMAKDKEVVVLNKKLAESLASLNEITSDSSYKFLQAVYDYPGVMKFLFNELQVRGIHSDYLIARSSEQVIPMLNAQIDNCEEAFDVWESIEVKLKESLTLKDQQLANCQMINSDNEGMIEDITAQRDKERHRKNFWRFTTAVAGSLAILLAAFGL